MSEEAFDVRPKAKRNHLPKNPEAGSKGRFPSWLHRPLPHKADFWETKQVIDKNQLHTVCEEAKCPNRLECYSKKTATFLTLGKDCTRNCGFCSVSHMTTPPPLDEAEPMRVAHSVHALGLKHAVLTMVARDDLADGGALQLAKIIQAIKAKSPSSTIEVLTSDFEGNEEALQTVLSAGPDIFNHNLETVRERTPSIRHKATYERSLEVLSFVKKIQPDMPVKSGLMVGLGETPEQVEQALRDLRTSGVDIITIGQYLQPDRKKARVHAFIPPEQFKHYETYGYELGFSYMYCGPFVRSSYNADQALTKLNMQEANEL